MLVAFETLLEKRNEWIGEASQWIEAALEGSLPEEGNTNIRRAALELLDDIFHIKSASTLMPVQQFFQRKMERAIQEIGDTSVVSGAVIWKLYNHSFVVKTAQHTLGFDIFRGTSTTDDMVMSDKQIERLGNMLDILFISHNHKDHFTLELAEYLVRNGKPIIAPGEVWNDRIIPLTRIIEGKLEFPGMKIKVFPGHQGSEQNNVYLVEADDVSIMHTGDQYNESNFDKWIDSVWREYRVDILIVNCWLGMNSSTNDLRRFVHNVDPQIVITGHENELEHTIDHRESYMKTFRHLEGERHPYFVMTWGERLTHTHVG